MGVEPELSARLNQRADPGVQLAEYWQVVVKRRRLIIFGILLGLAAGALISVLSPPLYRAIVLLNLSREQAPILDLARAPITYDPEFLPTQRDLIRSREVATRVVDRLRLTGNPDFTSQRSGFFRNKGGLSLDKEVAVEKVQESIETQPRRGTNLVELSVVQSDPKLAADMANVVAEAYIDWTLESRSSAVGQTSRSLETQIQQLRGEVQLKEQELQAYGRQKDIISIDPGSNATMQKLESFNRDYAAAVADRVAKEARFYQLQNSRPETIADNLSGLVSQLRTDLARLERDYAEKLSIYKPTWPAMQQARVQIEESRQNLQTVIQETVAKARDNARTEYQTALRREQSLKAVLEGQTNEAMTMNSNAIEYNNLQAEVGTKRELLDTLLKRQAETEVSSEIQSGERASHVHIVDKALVPRYRFRPSYKLNAAAGLMGGLLLSLGLAFGLEYLDRSLRSTAQVERLLQVPALGIIPALAENRKSSYAYRGKQKKLGIQPEAPGSIELLPQTQPRSTVAEAYRSFRTSLLLSRAGGLKTIAVTSVQPGEGKTTTAINLAVVLAQLDKRVLLIDADLHRPRVHEVFSLSNRTGLVSVLAENADPASVAVSSNVPGLFVVPSGPSSPNPSGLLSSDAMKRFLDLAVTEYDYIILDTPPVGPVADAILLGHQADGVVLCVHGGKTPRDRVSYVRDRLLRSNVSLLGILLNNLEQTSVEYAEYYGAYDSRYADGVSTGVAAG